MKLFLLKNAKFSRAGGSAPKPPKHPPNCESMATRLVKACTWIYCARSRTATENPEKRKSWNEKEMARNRSFWSHLRTKSEFTDFYPFELRFNQNISRRGPVQNLFNFYFTDDLCNLITHIAKYRFGVKTRHRLLIFYFSISLFHKKFLFWKIMMTSFHLICCLGPPSNQKYWLRLCPYQIRNVKQARFASKHVNRCCLLACFLPTFFCPLVYNFPSKYIFLCIQFCSLQTCNISCACV